MVNSNKARVGLVNFPETKLSDEVQHMELPRKTFRSDGEDIIDRISLREIVQDIYCMKL
jgi:hypothetical protein